MNLTLTIETPDGPVTLVGALQPPEGASFLPSLRFERLCGESESPFVLALRPLLKTDVRLEEVDAALQRGQSGAERQLSSAHPQGRRPGSA